MIQVEPNQFWVILGGIIVVCVVAYFAFTLVDARALKREVGTATVIGKEHRQAEQKHRIELIGGVTRSIPHMVPEMYVIKFRIGNREVEYPADKSYYDRLRQGDQVRIIYEQRRITGTLEVKQLDQQYLEQ